MATPVRINIPTKTDFAARLSVPAGQKESATEFNTLTTAVKNNYDRLIIRWDTDIVANSELAIGQYVHFTDNKVYRITTGYNVGNPITWVDSNATEVVGSGITREFNRAWSSELLFDKNEIEYAEHELVADLEFTVAETGHVSNQFSSAVQRIVTDGTRTITFTGYNFVLGDIQSGSIPDAGTYLVLFLYWNGVATVNWTRPSLEEANLTPLVAPANFEMVPGAGDPETKIDATWDAVLNATELVIELSSTGAGGPWLLPITLAAGATSYTRTGLTANTTYHQRIRAIGDQVVFSNSQYSVAAATTEDAGDVTAPTSTFSPADAATDIPINQVVTITCSEPIRDDDGVTEITSANVDDYLVVKEDNGAGADIPYTATIDVTKTIITITPNLVWPSLDNVFIQIDGVEDVNGNESAADSATFATSDFTLAEGNYLSFGNILNSIIAADNADFDLEFTAKDITPSVGMFFFRKYASNQRSFLFQIIDDDIKFKFYEAGAIADFEAEDREIVWASPGLTGEHTWELEYRGAVDTNNGLDRVTLKKDGVTVGSKTLTPPPGGGSWPFNIRGTSASLLIGPTSAQIKDLIIRSNAGATVELNVPVVRTGLDTSGNARHGTWV